MNYLVKGGQVFGEEGLYAADVRIVEGVIAEVGQNLAHKGEEIIEAEGCVLSPGFTDLHVHLRQPGYEQKETIETGTTAAAAGGFTTVCSIICSHRDLEFLGIKFWKHEAIDEWYMLNLPSDCVDKFISIYSRQLMDQYITSALNIMGG